MSSTPTTAGEMIGYLRLDPSDWKRNSAEVKADAKEIGRLNPHIRIDVDSAKALTQLSAVAAATKKLQDAQGQVTVSQAKLKEAQDSGTASASKLAKATEDLAKAHRAEQVASIQLAAAHEGLNTATKAASKSMGDAESAIDGTAGKALVLIPAIGALTGVLGPLLAVGAGLAGTLLLGISGLKDEVVSGLTPAFHGLQDEAAKALGPGVTKAVDQLKGALPQLKPLIDTFGAAIGNAGAKFATWLNHGGIADFVKFANAELPHVAALGKAAAESVGQVLTQSASKGNGTIDSLTNVLNILNEIGKIKSQIPTPKAGGSGGKGVLGDLGSVITDGPLGAGSQDLSNKLGNVVSSGLGKVPGALSSLGHALSPNADAPKKAPQLNSQTLQNAVNNVPVAPSLNSSALHAATNDLDSNTQATVNNAAALGTTITALSGAQAAAASFKASTAESTLEMQLENNAAGLLSQALSGLGGNALGVAASNTAFHASITAVNASLKENGSTLDINTAKGQANRQTIEQAVSAAQAHMAAIEQQTGSTKAGTDAYNADIATLEKQLGATGQAKSAIDAYITSIGNIPAVKSTELDIIAAVQVTAANLGQNVHSAINDITTGQSTAKAKSTKPVAKAAGGWINGPGTATSDSVRMSASRGEFVVQARYAAQYGRALESINAGKSPSGSGSGATVIVNPSAGMDERAVGKYAATYADSLMV